MINGFSQGAAVSTVINTGGLAGCGLIFKKMVEQNFLNREVLPIDRLHRMTTERSAIVDQSLKGQSHFEITKSLITNTLQFAEQTLSGWVPGTHLEFCVFIDAEQPLLFSYYDSQHDTVARSMASRKTNPKFYVEKGYEVTKLLRAPSSHPTIIPDTHAGQSSYQFTTDEQRRQIRSTLLLSLDLEAPIAMVVSSNEKNAFDRDNKELMSFLRYVGSMIRCDLMHGNFVAEVRQHNPGIFLEAGGPVLDALPAT